MKPGISKLRRKIYREARRALAAADLPPKPRITLILVPTAASAITLKVTVDIESKYRAEIDAVALGNLGPLIEIAENLGIKVYGLDVEPSHLNVLLESARLRVQGKIPVTPLTADDFAALALRDILSAPPIAAVIDAAIKPVHPLSHVLALEAFEYAQLVYPRVASLPPTLEAEMKGLAEASEANPYAARNLHVNLVKAIKERITSWSANTRRSGEKS